MRRSTRSTRIVPDRRVHTVGYCIGGTLLSIAAAALARRGDTRIASITLFAAQTDFSEPGELSVFITPSQLAALEQKMQQTGVLTSEQMGMSFALLRSADLVWAPSVNTYLRGKREGLNDLMAWNADGTRMPCRMHSEYLSRLYLRNELAGGQFPLDGEAVDLGQIQVPMFVVGTQTDHVAPWRSVYKVRGLTNSDDYTFLLTSGGHNAGIISGPVASEAHAPAADQPWALGPCLCRRLPAACREASRLVVADLAGLAGRALLRRSGWRCRCRWARRWATRRASTCAAEPLAPAGAPSAAAPASSQMACGSSRCDRPLTYMPMWPTSSSSSV